MADVFISYHENSAGKLVRQIADALKKADISCWYAKKDIKTGPFRQDIPQAIISSKIFLLILSKQSIASYEVQGECGVAFQRYKEHQNNHQIPKIDILLFSVDGSPISYTPLYYLSLFQTTNGNPPDEQHIQQLVKKIADFLDKKAPTPNSKSKIQSQQPMPPQKQTVKEFISGVCGEKAIYRLYQNRKLTILGSGCIQDYDYDSEAECANTPWWNRRRLISTLEIKPGITAIGDCAFESCTNLAKVTIPDKVTRIGFAAFSNCRKLNNITIPDSVESIEEWAFSDCMNLTSVKNGSGITYIGEAAFYGCTSLTSFRIHEGIIEDWAFHGCTNLNSVNILNGVKSIGAWAFSDCKNLKQVTIPDSVTFLGKDAFNGCTNLSISIPLHLTNHVAFPKGTAVKIRY